MSMLEGPIRARFACWLLAAAGLTLFLGCTQQPRAGTPAGKAAGSPQTTPQTPAPAASAPTGPAPVVLEPPDGKWLTDAQGRQYFLTELPRVEGQYRWVNPEKTQASLFYGMVFDIASYDDDSFQVKIYKVEPREESPAQRAAVPTPQDKEKVVASYRNGTGSADRLTFEPFNQGLPTRGQWRNGFKIADMNNDGHMDIVHGPARKSNGPPVIFLGDGKGGWRRWAGLQFPPLGYDYGDVAVADFNGDGRLDLALAVHLRGLLVLVADGPQSFKEWGRGIEFQVPGKGGETGGFSSRTLEAADWNGDGRPDLISLGEGPRLAVAGRGENRVSSDSAYGPLVYLNQGDGSWLRRDELKDGTRLFGEDLAVGDFTHDGHLDIVLGSSVQDDRNILRIGGNGGEWTTASLPGLRPSAYVGAVDLADFNGDGREDVAIGYLSRELGEWRTGIDVFLARKGGEWERRGVVMEENRKWLTALDSGDLDGDGKLDLVGATGNGEIWVFLGKGDGTFVREQSPEIPPSGGCRGYDVRIANLDDDPAEELVAEFAGESSAMFAPTQCLNEGSLTAWKARVKK